MLSYKRINDLWPVWKTDSVKFWIHARVGYISILSCLKFNRPLHYAHEHLVAWEAVVEIWLQWISPLILQNRTKEACVNGYTTGIVTKAVKLIIYNRVQFCLRIPPPRIDFSKIQALCSLSNGSVFTLGLDVVQTCYANTHPGTIWTPLLYSVMPVFSSVEFPLTSIKKLNFVFSPTSLVFSLTPVTKYVCYYFHQL